MTTETLDPKQPWPIEISLPEEPPRTREIQALADERVVASWRWRNDSWHNPDSFARVWRQIVQEAVHATWELRSVPVVDPLDAGTSEMVRKQIATHVTLPAFVAESCQFEKVTEGGKDQWRAIFQAGLDAYFAAGGTR